MSDFEAITPDDIPLESQVTLTAEGITGEESPYRCVECQRPLEYSGKGRRPTRCRKGEGCKAEPAPSRSRSNDIERIRQGMLENYLVLAALAAFFDQYDGMEVGRNASNLADSWANLAQQDPKVRKALMRMLSGTSWLGVIGAHVTVAIPILQHHKVVPTFAKEAVDQR